MSDETIFALASAPGRAGIAVVRISGPATGETLQRLGCALPTPRRATRAQLFDPTTKELLDDGLVLWFPGPHSFTGEDVAELHLHGGRAVIASVLEALSHLDRTRLAEPGEFTRRAFAHDKLDLTQAEALADVIDAETRAQAKQALRQMGGALKELYDDWRHRLVQALAHLEAVIDFPDEDLPPDVANKVWPEVRDLAQAIRAHLDDDRRGERVRAGVRIVIVGPPNAGKSSLLNWLARRDAAIVSDRPGTTRDVIEVHLDVGGFAVTVVDTAGLRTSADDIEVEGVRRAQKQAANADIKIVLFDGAVYPARDSETMALIDDNALVAVNKADLLADPLTRSAPPRDLSPLGRGVHASSGADKPPSPLRGEVRRNASKGEGDLLRSMDAARTASGAQFISVVDGTGMDAFMAKLETMIRARMDGGTSAPLTRARHRRGLEECVAALERAAQATLPELASEDLRVAARALGRLTGRVEVDEILDVVFRDFCIGK
ncbi:MAG: tRNA uridine-5-carboxymethylaminomethyl(34) synthesis GTPase MnmE [Rhodospirillaceae bacterium]|nr:MAG: tRNA uridine-5-carboxymethylaminomethyl(34) synthesis GTPase MnmE [Rhodospirillaceae bacterium]